MNNKTWSMSPPVDADVDVWEAPPDCYKNDGIRKIIYIEIREIRNKVNNEVLWYKIEIHSDLP